MKSLTIAIPTYHRTQELLRLLALVRSQVELLPAEASVNVLVRDNSNDNATQSAIENSEIGRCAWLDYKRNEKNVGFDLNILNLYCEAKGDYVWFIGDDDILYEGSIMKLLDLISGDPDIVHLPFQQPQHLEHPQYQQSPRVVTWTDMGDAVEQILKYIKITSFVLRRKSVDVDKTNLAEVFGHSGWMHLILAFEVLMNAPKVKSLTLAEFFAGSLDSEWKTLNWTPEASLLARKLWLHNIFKKHDLHRVVEKFEMDMYLGGIQTTLLVTSGKMSTLLPMKEYMDFGAKYPFEWYLLWKPVWLLKYLIIKKRAGDRIPRLIRLYEKVKK